MDVYISQRNSPVSMQSNCVTSSWHKQSFCALEESTGLVVVDRKVRECVEATASTATRHNELLNDD